MTILELETLIYKNSENLDDEFKRIFHGRGNFYGAYSYLTIDSINNVLFITLFEKVEDEVESALILLLREVFAKGKWTNLLLQRRYLDKSPSEVIEGLLPRDAYALENDIKYKINFSNKNIGFFPDMKIGHKFVEENSKDKNVLNLFSYTCAFSLCAVKGEASKVVNVDMAKGALTIGRENHHLNNFNTFNVQFMPYNILKSWNRIKKAGPYDLIIIDPPSFQKGSFAASKDYEKIIKRLEQLASSECIVLSALNAPELDTNFIKNIFEEHASDFKFVQRLDNSIDFPSLNEEKSLKNLVFKKS